MQVCRPIKEQTEHPVKARKVVHMHVRHEHLPDPGNRTCRKRSQVAEIEKDGTRLEPEIKQEACIAERLIDQPGVYKKNHTSLRRSESFRPTHHVPSRRNLRSLIAAEPQFSSNVAATCNTSVNHSAAEAGDRNHAHRCAHP